MPGMVPEETSGQGFVVSRHETPGSGPRSGDFCGFDPPPGAEAEPRQAPGAARTYTCARCLGTFQYEPDWTDDDAAAEMAATLQPAPGPVEVICDDCYQEFMAWAKFHAPWMLR